MDGCAIISKVSKHTSIYTKILNNAMLRFIASFHNLDKRAVAGTKGLGIYDSCAITLFTIMYSDGELLHR